MRERRGCRGGIQACFKVEGLHKNFGGLQPHQVAAKRLVRTFQETALFQQFTTFEIALSDNG